MTRRLVVGIDGSTESATALHWACDEARRRGLELHLIYALAIPVVSDAYGMVMTRPDVDELTVYSESLLRAAEAAARSIEPQVSVSTRLVSGPPGAVLVEASRDAAGLVVGSRGLGAMSGRMVGSVSVRVAAKGYCPVYVIPPQWTPATGVDDPVVVGVDGSAHGDAALALALDEARCRDATLRVVTAYHVPWLARPVEPALIKEFQTSEESLARRTVEEALERVRTPEHAGVRVDVSLAECLPTEALIAAGKESVLTCLGSRGRSEILRTLLGSVSRSVLTEATRPVAIVHAAKPAQVHPR